MEYIIKVSTKIQPHEDAERVFHSINNIFPDWKPDNIPKKEQYPTKRSALLVTGFSNSLDVCNRIVKGNLIDKIKENI